MKSTRSSISLLLEKGVEDKALLQELDELVGKLKNNSPQKFISKYPTVNELMYVLRMELEE